MRQNKGEGIGQHSFANTTKERMSPSETSEHTQRRGERGSERER